MKSILGRVAILFIFLLSCSFPARATHIVSNEIYYHQIDSNKIVLDLVIVRDCSSNNSAQPIYNRYMLAQSGSDSFTFFFSDSVNLIDSSTIRFSPESCGTCATNSNAQVFKRYLYRDTLDLSSYSNCFWRVSWKECCYAYSFSNFATPSNAAAIYNYCEFNRCEISSSPRFNEPSVFFLERSSDAVIDYSYQDTVDQADSFSLQFRQHLSDSGVSLAYASGYSASMPLTFFGYPNTNATHPAGFRLNSNTGLLKFRPTQNEVMPISMEITEWRKDSGVYKPIGRVTRTHVVNVAALNYSTSRDPQIHFTPDTLFVCRGDTSRFIINSSDGDIGDSTIISCQHDLNFITYETTNGVDSNARLNLLFAPGASDSVGSHGTIDVMASDYSCPISRLTRRTFHVWVIDSMQAAVVDAGADLVDSFDRGSFSLQGHIDHYRGSDFIWTTDGDGYFTDPTDLNTDYICGTQDNQSCNITLYLTLNSLYPCATHGVFQDSLVISRTFQRAFNNPDQELYYGEYWEWWHNWVNSDFLYRIDYQTSGDGVFDVDTSGREYYYPGSGDWTNCSTRITVSRYGCDTVSEDVRLRRKYKTLNAGPDRNSISNQASLQAGYISSYNSTLRWRTLGDGYFRDSLARTTGYVPGSDDWKQCEIEVVYEELPLNQCFHNIDTAKITMKIWGFGAGTDQVVQRGDSIQLNATSTTYEQPGGYWTCTGSGTFSDTTDKLAVYRPSIKDLQKCDLWFYWHSPPGNCWNQLDSMRVNFTASVGFDAGLNQVVNIHDTIWLDATSPLNTYPFGIWRSNGGGQFGDTSDSRTFYLPSSSDNSRCEFYLYWYSPSYQCDAERDSIKLIYNSTLASISVGSTYTAKDSIVLAGTAAYNGHAAGWWSTDGDGYFIDSSEINTLYIPHPNDFARCAHQLYWNTDTSLYPCTNPRSGVFVNFIPTIETSYTALDTTGEQFRISFSADLPDLMEWMDPKDSSWNNVYPGNDVIYTTDSAQKASGTVVIVTRQQTNCRTVYDTVTLLINYSPPTGILSLERSTLRAYPNPASNVLNIETEKPIELAQIYDATGREVMSVNSPKINIEKLAPGTYLLRVKFSDGSTGSTRWQKR